MKINYDKLKSSLKRLEERYGDFKKTKNRKELLKSDVEAIKESCIQRFEICIDTTWKHLKKYLQTEEKIIDIANSPKAIFRQAFTSKIIESPEKWFDFINKRGDTVHDYDGEKAENTFTIIPKFIKNTITLYEKMSGEKWD
ncbi:MAG: HI0074 family nucleotidyltransferase substrate-binding subunit [Alphaproteobacteria bacterium]